MKKTLAEHLEHAAALFDAGEVVKAGQIWQAIFKKDTSNTEARAGLLKVREIMRDRGELPGATEITISAAMPIIAEEITLTTLSPVITADALKMPTVTSATQSRSDAGLQTEPASPPADFEYHLQKGCSLYDMRDLHGALAAWEKALAIDPEHQLVLGYTRGVRKELGLPMVDGEPLGEQPPVQETVEVPAPLNQPNQPNQQQPDVVRNTESDLESLIQRGAHSYETGMLEDAIQTWKTVLELEPGNSLVKAYLEMAQKDLEAQRTCSNQSSTLAFLSGVEHELPDNSSSSLYDAMRHESGETTVTHRSGQNTAPVIAPLGPRPFREAVLGTELPVTAEGHGLFGARATSSEPTMEITQAKIPLSIIQDNNSKHSRLSAQNPAKKILSGFASPRVQMLLLLTVTLLIGCIFWIGTVKKDAFLTATQTSILDEVLKRAGQVESVASLEVTTEKLRSQARSALRDRPLLAYMLSQEAIERDPLDTAAVKLMEQAQQAMALLPSPGGGSVENLVAAGNLERAEALLEAQLRKTPDDKKLREQLARVSVLMVRGFAKEGKWGSARTRLMMGAALFPKDPIWQARLKLLEYLQSAPEEERQRWIELLG